MRLFGTESIGRRLRAFGAPSFRSERVLVARTDRRWSMWSWIRTRWRRHRAFHRRELAGDVEAGFSPFDHPDDVPQMPSRRAAHQVGMSMHVFHAEIISPQVLPLDVNQQLLAGAGNSRQPGWQFHPGRGETRTQMVYNNSHENMFMCYILSHSQRPSFRGPMSQSHAHDHGHDHDHDHDHIPDRDQRQRAQGPAVLFPDSASWSWRPSEACCRARWPCWPTRATC